MKISTKGRYTVEAMVDLAYHSKDQLENLKNISDRMGISKNYLEQLFLLLRKKGLVRSVRGAQGGYQLAKPASQISVGDILRTVEGDLSVVDCLESGTCCQPDGDFSKCVTKSVWRDMMIEINDVIDHIFIQDLVASYTSVQEESQNFDSRGDI